MASLSIFNASLFSFHTNVAIQSDPTTSSLNPCWVQEELSKRVVQSTTEEGFTFAYKAEEERRPLNGIYRTAHQEEEEEETKKGLPSTEDECLEFDAHNGEERRALPGIYCKDDEEEEEEDEDEDEEVIVSGDNPHISHTGTVGNVTLVGLLKACSDKKDLHRGSHIHSDIVKRGVLKKNVFLGSSLVNLYAKCGALEEAQAVFDELPIHSIVSWNALIGGYAQYEHAKDALNCYERMESHGFSPNVITFLCILKACGSAGVPDKGQYIHSQIVKAGLLEDTRVGTALVDMYAKCGSLVKAQTMFDSLTNRDVVSWTALILGYAQHEYGEEALKCFEQMQLEGLCPDALTSACVLKACGSVGVAYEGQKIHAKLVSSELLDKDMVAGSALVDMYANCGMLAEAQEVFDKLLVKNVVSWSALMEGYAQLGKDDVVFSLFEKMIREGTEPSWVTFTIVLNACCHRGLLDEAKTYFELLSKGYGIVPTIEHHTCMVDLFCRAGHLDKAIAVIEEMPICANSTLWHSLLDACQKWGNMELGRWAFERVLQLDAKDAAAYVCLSNFPVSRRKAWTRTKWKLQD